MPGGYPIALYRTAILVAIILLNSLALFAQSSVSDLLASLEKSNSPKDKAGICYKISRMYESRLKVDSALFYADKIKEFSLAEKYEHGLGLYHLATAGALRLRAKISEAQDNAHRAIEIFDKETDVGFLGLAYYQLGAAHSLAEEYEKMKENYWMSARLLEKARDSNSLDMIYFELGRGYSRTFQVDSAAVYFTKSLDISERTKDKNRIFISAGLLGNIFLLTDNFPEAKKYLEYSLQNQVPISNKVSVRQRMCYYAHCLIKLNSFNRADSVMQQIGAMNDAMNDAWGKAYLLGLRGSVAFARNEFEQALDLFSEANNVIAPRGIGIDVGHIVFELGRAFYHVRKYDSAIVHLNRARGLYATIKYAPNMMMTDSLMSECYQRTGNADSALYYFRSYAKIRSNILSLQKQQTLIDVTARYESEKKEQEIKILQKDAEANSLLLQLKDQQITRQQLEADKRSQALELVSRQNEINKLDASQKALSLENEKKENEKNLAKMKLLEQEAAYQKLFAAKQNQQRTIIYISIGVVIALGVYVVKRYLRRKNIQNQQQVLNERLRISRELHDEVGATLSGIAMYSHLTREQIKAERPQEVERSLNNIVNSAGEMVDKLSDIVWLVNPQKDSLQQLLERLEQYAEDMATVKGMEVRITVSPRLSGINLPVESRRSIYLFCKEAINNAVKYSNANVLELSLVEHNNKRFEIAVADNGKGFDVATARNGNGLTNMRQRAAEMGAEYRLDTRPGEGTRISIILKFT